MTESPHPKGILDRLTRSLGYSRFDLEERNRRLTAILMVIISVPVLFGFSFYHIAFGVFASGLVILPIAVAFGIVPYQLRSAADATNIFRVNVALAGLMLVYVFYEAAPWGQKALWLFLFPVASSFLLGKREGLLYSLVLFTLLMLVFMVLDLGLGFVRFERGFMVRFCMVFLMLCGCSYSYESVRIMFRRRMNQKHRELMEEKEKLAESKKLAEAANEAKSEFLANMTHEWRVPLNQIIDSARRLSDQRLGKIDERQREYLNYVLQSGNQLFSLMSDILDLSKEGSGQLRLDASEVNPRSLLEGGLTRVREEALKHQIQLMTDWSGMPEVIRADEGKLKHVVHNLLSNAVKFTPEGGSVHVSATRSSVPVKRLSGEDGSRPPPVEASRRQKFPEEFLLISVADTGIGIAPQDLERIFNPFEQVETSASRKYKGSGLGLTLSRIFVELHGGRIWAESDGEGKGSVFKFMLPV